MTGAGPRAAAGLALALAAALAAAAALGAPPRALAAGAACGSAVALAAWLGLRRHLAGRARALQRGLEELARTALPGTGTPAAPPADLARTPIDDALAALGERLRQQLRELEEERARLAVVLESMGEGVLVVDRSERVLIANAPLRTLLGAPRAAPGARLVEVVRHPELLDMLTTALERGAPAEREVGLADVAGGTVRVRATPFPRAARDPAPAGVVALVRDVTADRRLDATRRDFVANASHELKTPLTAIRGFAERLTGRDLGDPGAQRAAEAVLENAVRLGALVEDLLDLSRAESGRLELRREPVDLGEVAARLARGLAGRVATAELALEVGPAPQAAIALADPRAVEHVLGNLLENAVQYTDAGGRIRVDVVAEPGRVGLRVADTGIGIPAREIPRIFERFYRVDPARSRARSGTGLGLSIVRHLVSAMGGEVVVESRPGRGSTFTVWLPSGEDPVSPATVPGAA